jgi:peptidoglycan/xylan/chitin deacetylase (PgdA/CDA1 family)
MAEPMRKGETVGRALLIEAAVTAVALATARRKPLLSLAAAGAGAAAAWGAFARNSPLYGSILTHGPPTQPRFALTFDDGPGPSTAAVLDALRTAKARATFFVLGRQVEQHPDLVRRIVDEGHELANHGYDHGILVFRTPSQIREQLERTEAAVNAAVGPDALTRLFRVPHGFKGPAAGVAARRAGYRLAGWSVGVFDSEQPGADTIAQRAARALTPGGILLLHDADGWEPAASRDQTAEAIGPICAAARARGLEPVALGDLVPA